ncbi:hypothetical protein [Streptosporangium sp. NPDC002524]|uniref:hypothetical protein n=1 Tax=Streptosporangium sp. NPDC002524 TaxID=3154537 RepID=UPI00331F4297
MYERSEANTSKVCAHLKAGLVIASLLAVVSCADSSAPKVRVEGTDPIIIVHSYEGSHDALISGNLAYDAKSKCLRVGDDRSATPVWPENTRPVLVDGRRGVELPGIGTALEGDKVEGGGGGSTWRKDPPAGVTFPEGCLPPGQDGTVIIFGEVTGVTRAGH